MKVEKSPQKRSREFLWMWLPDSEFVLHSGSQIDYSFVLVVC